MCQAATIPKLVERLTFEKFIDIRFQSKFLLTFRAFLSPGALFDGLMRRYGGSMGSEWALRAVIGTS